MDFTVPKQLPNPEGQAKMILRSNGLAFVQPIFFTVDSANMALEQAQTPDLKNWMGLPVFDTVQIDEVHYTRNDGQNIGIDKMILQNVLHIVTIPKNIVKTPIPGGDGTVKEYIGLDDHRITLSGMLVSPHQNVPPSKEMKQLIDLCKAPVPLNLYSNFLALFEVFTVVVDEEPTFTQIEGTRNAVNFSINCVSDRPFEVEYNQANKSVSVPMFL
jgi:hypothetical protein